MKVAAPVMFALLVLGANPLLVSAAEHRDARELAPAALIGPWKADIAASTYAHAKPVKEYRTFQYDADGKVLVTFMNINANGEYATGHWAAQLDGTPGLEYHNSAGSIPYNVVSFKKVDDNNFTLVVSRNGAVSIQATYNLSPDGKTLTYAYSGNTIIYHRWDMMN
jgi:galactose mutarotase-like enzyme